MGGGDVEKDEFVSPLAIVEAGLGHRIAGVAQFHEVNALNDAAVLYIQTGDDTLCQHYYSLKQKNGTQMTLIA